jgi:hypothetical protein
MRTVCAIGVSALLALSAMAQQVKDAPKKAQPGQAASESGTVKTKSLRSNITVSGRVFAITKSGDLKPARLARIFLFYSLSGKNSEEKETAGLVYLHNKIALMEEFLAPGSMESRAEAEGIETHQAFCKAPLEAGETAANRTVIWALNNREAWQANEATADEEGYFSVSATRPGRYILIAFGHAGWQNGEWESEFTVGRDNNPNVKLAYPKEACADISEK